MEVHRLLTVAASLLWSRGSRASGFNDWHVGSAVVAPDELSLEHRLSICGLGFVAPRIWDLPGSGIQPESPALSGRPFATESPEEPQRFFLLKAVSGKKAICWCRQGALKSNDLGCFQNQSAVDF